MGVSLPDFARDGDRGRGGQGVCSQVLLFCWKVLWLLLKAKYPHVGILEREGHCNPRLCYAHTFNTPCPATRNPQDILKSEPDEP